MSDQEFQAVEVNGELMLARKFTLEDGSVQYRNKFGLAIEGAKPVQQDEPKPKRAPRARKKAAG
jgi:hypothetical protein